MGGNEAESEGRGDDEEDDAAPAPSEGDEETGDASIGTAHTAASTPTRAMSLSCSP